MPDYEALNMAIIQHNPLDCATSMEVRENIKTTLSWMDKACNAYPDADFLLFCEFGIQGANPTPNEDVPFEIPSEPMKPLLNKCRERGVWAAFNFQEKDQGQLFNTSIIVDEKGEIALKYRKVNTFVPLETNIPGNEFKVCKGPKGAIFGMLICYDGDFPETARELSFMGANVILRMTAYMEPYSLPWEFTNRARAYENTAYVAACNRSGTGMYYTWFGKSEVVDFDGKVLAQAPAGIDWMTKVEMFPERVNGLREKKRIFNHLYNLNHRGYTVVKPEGYTKSPYSFYKDWK